MQGDSDVQALEEKAERELRLVLSMLRGEISVADSRIINFEGDLLGDSVILHLNHLFTRLPGDPKRVS